MKTVKQEVHGKDLPKQWREKAKVGPDEVVIVSILPQASIDDFTHQLFELAEQVSAEAKRRGMTEKELVELLKEKHDVVAQALSDLLQDESRWEQLFSDPRSEKALDKLVSEAEKEIAAGKVYDYDPSNRPE